MEGQTRSFISVCACLPRYSLCSEEDFELSEDEEAEEEQEAEEEKEEGEEEGEGEEDRQQDTRQVSHPHISIETHHHPATLQAATQETDAAPAQPEEPDVDLQLSCVVGKSILAHAVRFLRRSDGLTVMSAAAEENIFGAPAGEWLPALVAMDGRH